MEFSTLNDAYRKALDRGSFNGGFSEFAKAAHASTGNDAFLPFTDDGAVGYQVKRASAGIDNLLEQTGLPWAAQQGGEAIGQMFGVDNPAQVGEMTKGAPRAALDMLPMMIPFVGPAAKYGMGAASVASAANAFEKTDSFGQAVVAGAAPAVASKLYSFGSSATLRGVESLAKKAPILKSFGLEGGRTVTEAVETGVADAIQEGAKYVGRKTVTIPDRVAGYLGGQAAAGGAFFAKDVIENGADALTPEALLGTVLNQVAFAPFDVHSLLKPQWTKAPTVVPPKSKLAAATPAEAMYENFLYESGGEKSLAEKQAVRRKYPITAAEMFARTQELSRANASAKELKTKAESELQAEHDGLRRIFGEQIPELNAELVKNSTAIKDPTARELFDQAVSKYDKSLSAAEDVVKNASTKAIPDYQLMGTLVHELQVTPESDFLNKDTAERTLADYQEQFKGKLSNEQIEEAWRHDTLRQVENVKKNQGKAKKNSDQPKGKKGGKGKGKKKDPAVTVAPEPEAGGELMKYVDAAATKGQTVEELAVEIGAKTGTAPEEHLDTLKVALSFMEGHVVNPETGVIEVMKKAPEEVIKEAGAKLSEGSGETVSNADVQEVIVNESSSGAPLEEVSDTAAKVVENAAAEGDASIASAKPVKTEKAGKKPKMTTEERNAARKLAIEAVEAEIDQNTLKMQKILREMGQRMNVNIDVFKTGELAVISFKQAVAYAKIGLMKSNYVVREALADIAVKMRAWGYPEDDMAMFQRAIDEAEKDPDVIRHQGRRKSLGPSEEQVAKFEWVAKVVADGTPIQSLKANAGPELLKVLAKVDEATRARTEEANLNLDLPTAQKRNSATDRDPDKTGFKTGFAETHGDVVASGLAKTLELAKNPESAVPVKLRQRGMVYTPNGNLTTKLTATAYNWLHDPAKWYKPGTYKPMTERLIVRDKLGKPSPAAVDLIRGKFIEMVQNGQMTPEAARLEIENALARGTSDFTVDLSGPFPEDLLSPKQRAYALSQALQTTVTNFFKGEWAAVADTPKVKAGEFKEVLAPHEGWEWKPPGKKSRPGTVVRVDSETVPKVIQDAVYKAQAEDPSGVYKASFQRVGSRKKNAKSEQGFWYVSKAANPMTLSTDAPSVVETLGDGENVQSRVLDAAKTENVTPYDIASDADTVRAIEQFKKLVKEPQRSDRKEILATIDEVLAEYQNLSETARETLIEAFAKGNENAVRTMLQGGKKAPPKIVNAIFRHIEDSKRLAALAQTPLVSDKGALTQAGSQIYERLMNIPGAQHNEAMHLIQSSTPDIQAELLSGSPLVFDILRDAVSFSQETGVMEASKVDPEGWTSALGGLMKLASGRSSTPIQIGGKIFYATGKPGKVQTFGKLSPLAKYRAIDSLRIEKRSPQYLDRLIQQARGNKELVKTLQEIKTQGAKDGKKIWYKPGDDPVVDRTIDTQVTEQRQKLLNSGVPRHQLPPESILRKQIQNKILRSKFGDKYHTEEAATAAESEVVEVANPEMVDEAYAQEFDIELASTTPLRAVLEGGTSAERISDLLVSPDVLANRLLDMVGLPKHDRETHLRDLTAVLEAQKIDDLGVAMLKDDLNRGVFGAANTAERRIFLAAPEGLSSVDRANLLPFVAAHEIGHQVDADAKAGRYGPLAQKHYLETELWAENASPQDRADVLDILFNGALPKRFQNESSRAVVATDSPSEFLANASAMHRMSLLGKKAPEVMTMLPAPMRRMFDWFVGHMARMTRAGKMLMAARGNFTNWKTANKVLKDYEVIRREARQAEQNIAQVFRLSKFLPENIAEIKTSMLEFVDPGVANHPAGKEWLELASGEDLGSIGDKGGTFKKNWNSFVTRTEDLARTYPQAFGRVGAVFRDLSSRVNGAKARAAAPIFGRQDASGNLVIDKDMPWHRVTQNPTAGKFFSRIGKSAQETSQSFIDAQGNFDPAALPREERGFYESLTPEWKKDIGELWKQTRLSQEISNTETLKAMHEDNSFTLARAIAALPEMAGKYQQAEDVTKALYQGLQTQDVGMLAKVQSMIPMSYESMAGMAQEMLTGHAELTQKFAESPFFMSLRRFDPIQVTYSDPQGRTHYQGSKTSAEARRLDTELIKKGYKRVGSPNLEGSGRQAKFSLNDAAMEVLGRQEAKLKTAIDQLLLPEDVKQQILEHTGFRAQVQKTLAAVSAEGFGTKRKLTSGYEGMDMLEQHLKYLDFSSRNNHNKILKSFSRFAMENPEARGLPEVANEFQKRIENYMAPDSPLASQINRANAVWFLGFNIPSHFVEMAQPVFTIMPEWQAMGGKLWDGVKAIKETEGDILHFYKESKLNAKKYGGDFWKAWKDPEVQLLMKEAVDRERIGFGQFAELQETVGFEQAKMEKALKSGEQLSMSDFVKRPLAAYANTSMSLYGMFTRHNALTGLLMGFKSAKARGMDTTSAVEEAFNFEATVNKSGGRSGRQSAPYSSKLVGQLFYSLQGYTTGWFGQLGRYMQHGYGKSFDGMPAADRANARKAARTMLLAQLGAAGILGFPMVGSGLALLEELTGESLKDDLYKALDDVTGDPVLNDLFAKGFANSALKAAGSDIDLYSRFAIGGLFGLNEYDGYSLQSLAGPTGGMLNSLWGMGKSLAQEGDIMHAAQAGGPAWMRKMAELVNNDSTVGSATNPVKKLDSTADKLFYAAGFNNTEVSKIKDLNRSVRKMQDADTRKMGLGAERVAHMMQVSPQAAQAELQRQVLMIAPAVDDPQLQQELYKSTRDSLVSKASTVMQRKMLPGRGVQEASSRVEVNAMQMAEDSNTAIAPTNQVQAAYLDRIFRQTLGAPVGNPDMQQRQRVDQMTRANQYSIY